MPKESSALYGLSFYNIIIRPLIKIILSTTENDTDEYKTFLAKKHLYYGQLSNNITEKEH